MKRLPALLLVAGLLSGAVVTWLHTRNDEVVMRTVQFRWLLLDADGHPLAGAAILRQQRQQWQLLGNSDTFGSWRGSLSVARDEVLVLAVEKASAAGMLRAQRHYQNPPAVQEEVVHLQLELVAKNKSTHPEQVRLEVDEPYLWHSLLAWCQRAGLHVAADGAQVLAVQHSAEHQLQVRYATGTRELFRFQVTYTKLRSHATLQKILRGIYTHMPHPYTAWHEEESRRWYVYNPAGFWHLRADAVLVNAQGQRLRVQSTTGQQLVLAVGAGESICRQQECVVYPAHPRQHIY